MGDGNREVHFNYEQCSLCVIVKVCDGADLTLLKIDVTGTVVLSGFLD